MPRSLRSDFAGQIYHALNRGNARNKIFFKDADFEAFERVVQLGLEKYPVDLIAYQWMGNHWHMVISPQKDKAMSAFLGWVTMTHTQRYHAHNKTTGYVRWCRVKAWKRCNQWLKPTICPNVSFEI